MTTIITGEDVLADRKSRKLGRAEYGALVGLTQTQIRNIEQGRAMRLNELEQLGRLLMNGVEVAAPPAEEPAASAEEPATTAVVEEPTPVVEAFPADGIKRFSHSELKTFKRCRRKWWLSQHRKLRLKAQPKSGARELGTRIHAALAPLYQPGGCTKAEVLSSFKEGVTADMAELGKDPLMNVQAIVDLNKDSELGRLMLEGYLEWLEETGADADLEPLASEVNVEVDFGAHGARLIGRLDARLRRKIDDAQLFMDHKTVGDLTGPLKTLHMDEQMLHYHLLELLDLLAAGLKEEADKVRTAGALYNMLRKVKRTERATPPFYDRVEVRHNIHELRSYWMRVSGEMQDILRVEGQLRDGLDPREVAYPNPTKDCSWDCDFFGVCPMFDDGSRAEDFITEHYVEGDPLARYAQGS